MDEDERLGVNAHNLIESQRVSNMDSKGTRGKKELANVEDLLNSKGGRVSKVIHAVNMISETDPIDEIIIDRITNTKDRSQKRRKMTMTGANMN